MVTLTDVLIVAGLTALALYGLWLSPRNDGGDNGL